jgi:hypothetical protein
MIATQQPQSKTKNADVRRLLDKARARPGVREAMQVYRAWQAADRALRPYSQAMDDKPHITASDSSGATSW